ncbi:sialate O-acetylesterase [Roseibacillus ishigakijimensis]|uniref:Sialate O-acetylesterase domain-containing protein n=1 Tax=Roseibacillus ishigakijimensis TaxID=454146 RepID=A0A934RRK7_9BACT|nr:sialate O-acetylesterase [Roseibacillus ishigakijimensis]MBK1833241.1 hypothetical protein [Roseibacillus ishigakijimensis]
MTRNLFLFSLVLGGFTQAALEVPAFFSDGMVLQQQGKAKVWGWLDSEEEVTVTFAGQSESARPNGEGRWEVTFSNLAASAEGRDLVITGGAEEKVIRNVLVGEVWLASGQSNMEWPIARTENAEEAAAQSADPYLRVYLSQNVAKAEPQIDFPGQWAAAAPETTGQMTAVGYYFARKLRAELEVPVAIIECSWGGKPVEAFTSEEALAQLPEAEVLLERKANAIASWDEAKARADYEAALAKWEADGKQGRRPGMATDPSINPSMPATLYNGMIAPLVGYGVRGAIWYQGESNANPVTAANYEELLGGLVADWRQRWEADLAFYYVQLANFRQPTSEPGVESHWVTVQDEMRRALDSISHSGMAVINEIGEANDIHPRNKKDVGERLARWALGQDYGREDVVMSGPLFDKVEKKDQRLVVSFEHNAGLQSRDGEPLQRFEIKAEDGPWVWAQAKIEGGKVIVWSEEVAEPAEVRYAWADNPAGANLVNGEGLPASCFTSEE